MRNLHDIGKYRFGEGLGYDLNKFLDSFLPTSGEDWKSSSSYIAATTNPTYFYQSFGTPAKATVEPVTVKFDHDWPNANDLNMQYTSTRCTVCDLRVYGILPRGKTRMIVTHNNNGGHTPEYR